MNIEDVQLKDDYSIKNGSENFNEQNLRGASKYSTSEQRRMVVPHTEELGGKYGTGSGRHFSMAAAVSQSPKDFELLVEEIYKMGNIFFDYVNGKDIKTTWKYISDVIQFDTMQQCFEIVDRLREYGRTRRTGMFGFSVEHDHIHVIHDCAFSGSHCRDVWRKQVEPFGSIRPTRTENKSIWKFNKLDWYDVFHYFFLRKRGTREIFVRGKSWEEPSDGK